MPWFRSREDAKSDKGNAPPPRTRWRRLRRGLRTAGLTLGGVLSYGVVVSIVGFCRAPAVPVSLAPDSSVRVTEVTRMVTVRMHRVLTPHSVEEIARAVAAAPGPISIGGGRYSMGGQTATPDGVQLDLREFHGVVAFDTAAGTITVHSGTRWREVQEAIDSAGFAVKIMQTYNTFTVGGALSVNAHGRYIGQGPLVRSVRAVTIVLADGRVVAASPREHPELFYGAIGGYGALGVIADVTLDLARNTRVQRIDSTLPVTSYLGYFRSRVQPDSGVIFHNADIYPPAYQTVHAVSYVETPLPVTVPERIQPRDQATWTHRLAYKSITSGRLGKWIRQHILDPAMFRGHPVTWRNYEASYDVSELEPASRDRSTYVLQEYFVPADSLPVFVPRMRQILQAHRVNAVNVSIRHALPDPGTDLAWAPTEVFAYVLYYKQGTSPDAEREVGRWTRELIEAAIRCGGRYYLPYQPLATRDQFGRAYPGAARLFAEKRRVDPTNKFTNTLWDLYEPGRDGRIPDVSAARMPAVLPAEVSIALDTVPGYGRPEGPEYLTHPEWDLVYSSEAYARWLQSGKPPSEFPYVQSVGTFWRSYLATWRASRARSPAGFGTHLMLGVIGISTAVEYGVKGLYETTLGRLAELNAPRGGTAEDRYAAAVAEAYAQLINEKGWYEFSFRHALVHLWADVPWVGPGFLRKWERRVALSVEYGVKAVYATLIGLGTSTAYAPDDAQRYLVVAGWSDSLAPAPAPDGLRRVAWLDRHYALLVVPRYAPFRDALVALAHQSTRVRIAEISGNAVVTFTGTAPRDWHSPGRTRVVAAYAAPGEPGRMRVVLAADVRDLLTLLAGSDGGGALRVDHIYDY
jgi:FAD/FMN-containing dehydrogenase